MYLGTYAIQKAKFMGPTWGPPGSCRPQMGPTLVPCILLSGYVSFIGIGVLLPRCQRSNVEVYSKIGETTTKHNKSWSVCICFWKYCSHPEIFRTTGSAYSIQRWTKISDPHKFRTWSLETKSYLADIIRQLCNNRDMQIYIYIYIEVTGDHEIHRWPVTGDQQQ